MKAHRKRIDVRIPACFTIADENKMIITLLSDFGYRDNFVAVAKGILLQHVPEATLIDLNHEVQPYNKIHCSYQLKSALAGFAANTIHLSLFEAMPASDSRVLVAKTEGQFVVSADNGLLPLAFADEIKEVYSSESCAQSYLEWITLAAGLIAAIVKQQFRLEGMRLIQPAKETYQLKPIIKENAIECQVIHIDRFDNVVLNLSQKEFELQRSGRNFRISLPGRVAVTEVSRNYSDVPEHRVLCLFNSAGFLEIAINNGQASSLLGLSFSKPRQMVYQLIKIEFS